LNKRQFNVLDALFLYVIEPTTTNSIYSNLNIIHKHGRLANLYSLVRLQQEVIEKKNCYLRRYRHGRHFGIFKMAAIKYKCCHISASDHPIHFFKICEFYLFRVKQYYERIEEVLWI